VSPDTLAAIRAAAARSPHGTRARYVLGCHCDGCRAANVAYYHTQMKARVFHGANGFVAADPVREHLAKLSRKGVGRRAVSATANIPESTLRGIVTGERRHIRALSEQRILAVTLECASDRAHIPAGPTAARLRHLLREEFSRSDLARRLGTSRQALSRWTARPTPRHITARTAMHVQRLYDEVMAEGPAAPLLERYA